MNWSFTQYQIKAEPPPASLPNGFMESPWHEPWSEPVRVRINPRLAVALGVSGGTWAPSLTFPSLFFESNWHQPWSLPVRVKPRLPAPLNPYYFAEPFGMVSPEATTEARWHFPWSEPIRLSFRRPLHRGAYPFYFGPDRLLPRTNVTMTMSTVELNLDIFTSDVNVYTPAPSVTSLEGAKVSIIEVATGNGPISIREGGS